ncbi:hypothetical protein L6452_20317 [Arctium lappa]|uniref:Uncharacterized protein n=1 Tax=Arctium lappa TaxID=4217 RepID=A0ACB9BAL0_ARCLA|nr:hypothetical protein L6452_20317 [Arctium lappa]
MEILLKKYDPELNVFKIKVQRLNVTLQDILYITGLPIQGKALITSRTRNKTTFRETMGFDEDKPNISMTDLQNIAMDVHKTTNQRMRTIFLLIIDCVIIPSADVKMVTSTYVEFVRDLTIVNSYAWGAALLAYLYDGLKTWKEDEKRKSVKGNLWVVLVNLENVTKHTPMFYNIIAEVRPSTHDHHYRSLQQIKNVIKNLSSDFTWSPYQQTLLPPALNEHKRRVVYLGPIICLNYVANHTPNNVHKQFVLEFGGFEVEKVTYTHKLKKKENKGSHNIDFTKIFKREVDKWNEGKTVEEYPKKGKKKRRHSNVDNGECEIQDEEQVAANEEVVVASNAVDSDEEHVVASNVVDPSEFVVASNIVGPYEEHVVGSSVADPSVLTPLPCQDAVRTIAATYLMFVTLKLMEFLFRRLSSPIPDLEASNASSRSESRGLANPIFEPSPLRRSLFEDSPESSPELTYMDFANSAEGVVDLEKSSRV